MVNNSTNIYKKNNTYNLKTLNMFWNEDPTQIRLYVGVMFSVFTLYVVDCEFTLYVVDCEFTLYVVDCEFSCILV
jgi:hypothetical protein